MPNLNEVAANLPTHLPLRTNREYWQWMRNLGMTDVVNDLELMTAEIARLRAIKEPPGGDSESYSGLSKWKERSGGR